MKPSIEIRKREDVTSEFQVVRCIPFFKGRERQVSATEIGSTSASSAAESEGTKQGPQERLYVSSQLMWDSSQ